MRWDLGKNLEAMKSFRIKILDKKWKNIILNTIYRPSKWDIATCENYFKILFVKSDSE